MQNKKEIPSSQKYPLMFSLLTLFVAIIGVGGFCFWQMISVQHQLSSNKTTIQPEPKRIPTTQPTVSTTTEEHMPPAAAEVWFTSRNWNNWYDAKRPEGNMAIQYLNSFDSFFLVPSTTAKDFYVVRGISNYNYGVKDYIVLDNCLQIEAAKRIGGEYTPGMLQLDIYSLDKDVVDGGIHEIYFSDDMEEDSLGNHWPRLYGPFLGNVRDIMESFEHIECKADIDTN